MMFKGLTLGLLLGIAVVSARPSKDTENATAVNPRSTRSVESGGLKVSKCVCDQNLDKLQELIGLLDEIKCSSTPGKPHEPQIGYPGGAPGQAQHPVSPGYPGIAPSGQYPNSCQPQPGSNYPGHPQPGSSYPGNPPPGSSYPGSPQPGSNYPGQDHPQPGSGYPNQPQPGSSYPGHPQPGSSYPGYPQPGSSYPGQPQPGSSYPGHPQPGSSYPGQHQPGSSYPGQPQPGSSNPGQPQPGSSYPGKPQTGNSHPGQDQPQTGNSHPGQDQPQPTGGYTSHGQPQPGYPGQTPSSYSSSSQHTSQSGVNYPGATEGQIQTDYTSNSSNSAPSKETPSNGGSTLPKEDITQDDNNQDKSSTTDTTTNQSIDGNNNVQVSNVTETTNIIVPDKSTPQQPVSGYPGVPSNSTPSQPPTGDASQPTPSSTSSSGEAPPAGIKPTDDSDESDLISDNIALQNVEGGDATQNVNSNSVNTEINENNVYSGAPSNISVFEIEGIEALDEATPDDSKPQVEQPTEASAPTSQIKPDSTQTSDISKVPSSSIEEIATAGSKESNKIPTANQNGNTNVNGYPINPVQPQTGYKQPQQPTSTVKNDFTAQQTDNNVQITNIEVSPNFIPQQGTSYQQTQYQTIREQGDVNSAPTLIGHDIIYNNSPVDNTPQVNPTYNTPTSTPIYNTPTSTPIYNTPPSTPISYNPQPNNGEETEIIIEEIKKPASPYIHEMEFSGSGDIMNYFDMKQISGVPNSHGGFNSYQSCTKNVYDKDVQTLKNELNAQQITLDKIVASLKKCNCYCVA